MKKKLLTIFFLVTYFFCKSQDTIIHSNNFKFKIGIKYIPEHSSRHILTDTASYLVNNFGVPFIIHLGKSKSYIETGLYYITKKDNYDLDYYYYSYNNNYNGYYYYKSSLIAFHYLRVPINYRLETQLIYLSAGFYFDNLLSMVNKSYKRNSEEFFPDRKFKTGINIDIGIEKVFHKWFSVFAEIRFSTDLDKEYFHPGFSYVNGKPLQNFGFGIGINYKMHRSS